MGISWHLPIVTTSTSDRSHYDPDSATNTVESISDVGLLDAYSQAVISVVDEVGPAVVSIQTLSKKGRPTGLGSGVVMTPDGYVLTNSHVVQNAKHLRVLFMEGGDVAAERVGDDPATDLALLRAQLNGLSCAKFTGSPMLKPGQLAVALGNPLGYQSSVTAGVVSAVGRALRSRAGRLIENVVQHTAPLNPGNSGGPLLDSRCHIIGINTAIIVGAQNIGFAIPASTADWVVPQLLQHGVVRRGHLGIAARQRSLSRRTILFHQLNNHSAVEVLSITTQGPADRAGINTGDFIVAIDSETVNSVDDLHRYLSNWQPRHPIELTLLRRSSLVKRSILPEMSV